MTKAIRSKGAPEVSLPLVTVRVPCWKLVGTGKGTTWESKDNVLAEVLTLHIEKGTMRVRYITPTGSRETIDVASGPFWDLYEIVRKND